MTAAPPAAVPAGRLAAYYFCHFATLGGMLPFLPLFFAARGFTPVQVGQLLAVFLCTKLVAPNVWGLLADRRGRLIGLVRGGSLLAAIGFAGLLIEGGFWWTAGIIAVFSFFWNAALPLFESVTLRHLGRDVGRYSRIRLWGSIGFLLVAAGYGPLLSRYSADTLPALLLPLFIAIWLCSLAVPEPAAAPGGEGGGRAALWPVLREPMVIGYFAMLFLTHLSHGAYYGFFSLYLETLGYGRGIIGAFWAIGVLAEVVLFLSMPRLLRYAAPRTLMLGALALTVLRWGLTATLAAEPTVLVLAQMLHAASFGLCHALGMHYLYGFFPGALQGRGQGLYSSLSFGAGGAVGALISGYLWGWQGGWAAFAVATAFALGALLVAAGSLPETARRALPDGWTRIA